MIDLFDIIDNFIESLFFRFIDSTVEGLLGLLLIFAVTVLLLILFRKGSVALSFVKVIISPIISQIAIYIFDEYRTVVKLQPLKDFLLLKDIEMWQAQVGLAVVYVALTVFFAFKYTEYRKQKRQDKELKEKDIRLQNFIKNQVELKAEEFIKNRNSLGVIQGIYALHNKKQKNKTYVGQGENVIDRLRQHLTGSGNGDVYADYKYNNPFTVRMISLAESGFNTLDELEKVWIKKYNAYEKDGGYNKTRGNNPLPSPPTSESTPPEPPQKDLNLKK